MAFAGNVAHFYIDGFRGMRLGRILWFIVVVKLVILFGVVRVWLMPDHLQEKYSNDAERASAVLEALTGNR